MINARPNENDIENQPPALNSVDDILVELEALLDSIEHNQSLITSIANRWGELSVWYKIGGGIVLFSPFLAVGLLAHNTLLITLTCFSAIVYAITSFGLDNHYESNKLYLTQLRSSITRLVNILVAVIHDLHELRDDLTAEVHHLEEENQQFTQNNTELKEQNQVLTALVQQTSQTANDLMLAKDGLEQANNTLESDISELKTNIDNVKEHNQELCNLVSKLSDYVTMDKESRKLFTDNLEHYLNDVKTGTKEFTLALGNLSTTGKILAELTTELKENTQQNQNLLKEYQQELDSRLPVKRCMRDTGVQTDSEVDEMPMRSYFQR